LLNINLNIHIMKKYFHLLLVGLFMVGFSACKSGESISTNPASLQGDWKITAMNGNEIPSQMRDVHTISFNTDGTVAGLANCNRFAGTYSAQQEGGTVSMNNVSATKLDCESKSNGYLDALTSANSFQIKGENQLVLSSSGGSGQLVFTKEMSGEEDS